MADETMQCLPVRRKVWHCFGNPASNGSGYLTSLGGWVIAERLVNQHASRILVSVPDS